MFKREGPSLGKNVVVHGATLKCSESDTMSFLKARDLKMEIDGKYIATVKDHKPTENIIPFGICKHPKRKNKPCKPVTPTRWKPGEASVKFSRERVLDDKSKCKCDIGGIIEIVDSGQAQPFYTVDCMSYSDAAMDFLRARYLALKRRADTIKEQMDAENEAQKPGWVRRRLGDVADFVPYVGSAKAVDEAITGWDIANQKELKGLDRFAGLIPGGRRIKRGFDAAKKRIVGEGGEEAGKKKVRREAAEPNKQKRKERRKQEQEENAQRKGNVEGAPRNNQAQNKQFKDAARGLSKDERRRLHEEINRQNLTREQIIERRNDMFPNNPHPGS